ncbi:MAG: septal ring lytic transglycosylase RlpA family protein [Caulobacterales bacterium]
MPGSGPFAVMRRRALVAVFIGAHLAVAPIGAAYAAAPGSTDYGYGSQAAPAPGQPIDLRASLPPVRKIDPALIPARATRPPALIVEAKQQAAQPVAPPPRAAPVVQPPAAPIRTRPEWLETERVGAPYEAKGVWYVPTPDPGYAEVGRAVAFEPARAGRPSASGEPYAPDAIVAAHPTLPLPSLVQVTNLENGRELIVRLIDRGPFEARGLIALSPQALTAIGASESSARVHVRYLGPAPRRVDATGRDLKASPPVAPPAPAIAAPSLPPQEGFIVQVGAFGAAENAERVRRTVAAAGPAATDARGGLHRVRVGPIATRAEAEQVRNVVAGLGFPSAIIAALR